MYKKSFPSWQSFFTYSIVVTLSLLLFLYAGPTQSPSLKPQVIVARAVHRDGVFSNLTKRDTSYEDAVTKGYKLRCMMAQSQSDKPSLEAASYLQKHGREELEGWEESENPTDEGAPFFDTRLDAALAALGVDSERLDIAWSHDKPVEIESTPGNADWIKTTPSFAYFMSSFFPEEGVIIADNNLSVDGAIKDDEEQDIPQLNPETIKTHVRRWSDAAWMQWTKACEIRHTDTDNVNYIFRATVQNVNSLTILLQAIRQKYSPTIPPIGVWNNRLTLDFNRNPDEFSAVLGSPNGSGVAFLLMTHKGALGIKTVSRVDIFIETDPFAIPNSGIGNAKEAGISLLFYVTAP